MQDVLETQQDDQATRNRKVLQVSPADNLTPSLAPGHSGQLLKFKLTKIESCVEVLHRSEHHRHARHTQFQSLQLISIFISSYQYS